MVTRLIRARLGAMFTGIALREGSTMRFVGLDPLPVETARRWARFDINLEAPVAAACRNERVYLHCDRAHAEADFAGIMADLTAAGTSAMAHLPLIASGVAFGTLAIAWSRPRQLDSFSPFLRIAAGQVALALQRVAPIDVPPHAAGSMTRSVIAHHPVPRRPSRWAACVSTCCRDARRSTDRARRSGSPAASSSCSCTSCGTPAPCSRGNRS